MHGSTLVYTHELAVRARQLASVAQLVRALHRNRRPAGSISSKGPKVAFFAAVPGYTISPRQWTFPLITKILT